MQRRYDNSKVLVDNDTKRLESWEFNKNLSSSSEKVFVVTHRYINRIDLIAYKFYNNSNLWWIIAKRNNLFNPLQIPLGKVLYIPDPNILV